MLLSKRVTAQKVVCHANIFSFLIVCFNAWKNIDLLTLPTVMTVSVISKLTTTHNTEQNAYWEKKDCNLAWMGVTSILHQSCWRFCINLLTVWNYCFLHRKSILQTVENYIIFNFNYSSRRFINLVNIVNFVSILLYTCTDETRDTATATMVLGPLLATVNYVYSLHFMRMLAYINLTCEGILESSSVKIYFVSVSKSVYAILCIYWNGKNVAEFGECLEEACVLLL